MRAASPWNCCSHDTRRLERLLHRLSLSPHRERFVLKGAMLPEPIMGCLFGVSDEVALCVLGECVQAIGGH